jgi:hypothetical protein
VRQCRGPPKFASPCFRAASGLTRRGLRKPLGLAMREFGNVSRMGFAGLVGPTPQRSRKRRSTQTS